MSDDKTHSVKGQESVAAQLNPEQEKVELKTYEIIHQYRQIQAELAAINVQRLRLKLRPMSW